MRKSRQGMMQRQEPSLVPPHCPVTGEPAVRLVQKVGTELLARLWKLEFKVNARPSFQNFAAFNLWESPTGLYFFDPPLEGDAGFYVSFYRGLLSLGLWSGESEREEFKVASRHIREGERVLDFGCGFGAFRLSVPQAIYTGLDPHFSGDPRVEKWAKAETLDQHLTTNAATYDVACAFQVFEHLAAPLPTFRKLVATVRPGGRVMIGVPHVPSLMTEVPNYLINAPPHHLTWWTEDALRALAARAGLSVEHIVKVPWNRVDSIIYWAARCSPIKARTIHYRHHWTWHASALIGAIGGYILDRTIGVPRRDKDGRGAALLLIARKA